MWVLFASPLPPVRLNSFQELSSFEEGMVGLWLESASPKSAQEIECFRRHSLHAYLPVFVGGELPETASFLCDGVAESLEAALTQAEAWRPSLGRLREGEVASPAVALARYLFLRPSSSLAPVRDSTCRLAYRYPLLEAFAEGEAADGLLKDLRERGWIDQTSLVDRLRSCNKCCSVHLNYVDVCPACKGLAIAEKSYIHCFTCSHVAPQHDFQWLGTMSCPNCKQSLKHIGVDYSRPLEQMHCTDCALTFAEAKVVARCLECACENNPESLSVKSIFSYSLSERGRAAAICGGESVVHTPLLRAQEIASEAFAEVLDWLLSLAGRHEGARFALVGLRWFVEESEGSHPEDLKHAAPLKGFPGDVKNFMRSTDLFTCFGNDQILIVLPHTNQEGGEEMLKRVLKSAEGDRGSKESLRMRGVVQAVNAPSKEVSAERIIENLSAKLKFLRIDGGDEA